MSIAEKFDFESLGSEDETGGAVRRPARKRAYTEAEIDSLKQAAFEEGQLSGEHAALGRVENYMADALQQLGAQCQSLLPEIDQKLAALHIQSAELGLAIARVLTPALLSREPLAEIEALFRECVSHLHSEPRIVLRVEETLVEPMSEHIDMLATQSGYPGRIVLIGEPGISAAACQIEWVDGGAVFDADEQFAAIEKIIQRYIESQESPPAVEIPTAGGDLSTPHTAQHAAQPETTTADLPVAED